MKNMSKCVVIVSIMVILILAWVPWMDDDAIHDKIFRERAHKDGTLGWVVYPNGTEKYELICDYSLNWFPFGRTVASCEGTYYVTFWGTRIP